MKYYNSGREADACMKFAMIPQLFIIYLPTNYWVNSQLNFLPFQIVFYWPSQYQQHSHKVGGWGERAATKWQAKVMSSLKLAKWHPLVPIFTSKYHTRPLNPWPNSSASPLVNYSQLSTCQGDMQPFEGDSSTHEHLTSLRNKPQQKQPRQLSASMLA